MNLKKVTLLCMAILQSPVQANVKVFINNSQREFLVRVEDCKNHTTALHLTPGAVQDLFLEENVINKIVIQNEKSQSKMPFSSMTHSVLRKETSAINDNMIFIIEKDASVKMYQGTTSRDEALRKIDEAYTKKAKLPSLDLSIHTVQTNKPWTTQKIDYTIKANKGFLKSIESIFS